MYVGCNDAECAVTDSLIENNWIHDNFICETINMPSLPGRALWLIPMTFFIGDILIPRIPPRMISLPRIPHPC